MTKLVVVRDGEFYSEKAEIEVKRKIVRIEHITLKGFLYNKQCDISDDYVTVVINGKSRSYYSSWDYLEFVECEVEILT